MAQTPLGIGDYFLVQKENEDDPESPINAYLVQDDGVEDTQWRPLGNSFGGTPEDFVWMVSCLATFHGRQFVNESGVNI